MGPHSTMGRGFDLNLDGGASPEKEQVCSSAELLDPSFLLDKQVMAVAKSAFAQVWPFLAQKDLATVTYALGTWSLCGG